MRKTFLDGVELNSKERWDEVETKYGYRLLNYIAKVEDMFCDEFEPITKNFEGHVIEVRY